MARVTVEDCLDHVDNRFKLVLLASKRARQLSMGTEPLVEWENDKPTVVALREIEKGLVNEEMIEAALAEPSEEEMPFDEDDLAAALHAEISRELNQAAPEIGQVSKQPNQEPAQPAEQLVNPFSSSLVSGQANTPDDKEQLSMESLLAKELAVSADDTPKDTSSSDTPSSDSSNDYGIPTPSSDRSIDEDQ